MCRQILRLIFIWLLAALAHATPVKNQFQAQYDHEINVILKKVSEQRFKTLGDKIDYISQQFLGKPYLLFALGEGSKSLFNQRPLYRTDYFDCETLVDTTLALIHAQSITEFKQHINAIRYHQGTPSFVGRNHFISMDWNPNNQEKAYIKNITSTIKENGKPVFKKASALINKPNWYKHLGKERIYLPEATPNKVQEQLNKLRNMGILTQAKTVTIDYIPLSTLFDANQQANIDLFKQIPHGAILEIVRPNWQLKDTIGTNLHVSHLGFVIWKNGTPYFRNASSAHQIVEDELLIDYLKHTLSSPTIKGIHLELALP